MNDLKLSLKGIVGTPTPKEGFQSLTIEAARKAMSTKSNPMVELKTTSASIGNHLTTYMTYHDDKSMRRLRQLLEDLVASNPEAYSLEDVEAEELDLNKLVGLKIGAYLRFSDSSHRYLEVGYFCPISYVQ